ncbi:MAG: hypothetical protein HKN15_13440 [Xanthomonadales bacterium]|nr:hypothetical protein [Xanthomonadales bacterium]
MISIRSICRFAIASALLACSQTVGADNACDFTLVDGEITEHKFSGFHGSLRVFVPAEPPPEAGYPVIAYYHGWSTGLKPNLRIMRAVTGGKDYLLIGMSYRSRHFYQELDRKSLRKEQAHLDRALEDVAACRSINQDVVFLAGYSQGGYAISMLGEQRIDEVAGLVLLGSGRRLAKMYLPDENQISDWPIFVGVGENDQRHFPIADNSAKLYALLGAEVSMETWPDTDHFQGWAWYQKDPQRGAGLKAWLDNVVARRMRAAVAGSGE